jgi:predicted permease
MRRFFFRLASFFRSTRDEAELAREINAHLRLLEDKFLADGMSPEDARYAARRAFGGVEQTKERQRDARTFPWLTGWPMDLKLGVRMLVKTPGLTVVGVAALAVAIGAGAAYHEFMRDMAYATLLVPGADRIVGIQVWDTERRAAQRRVFSDFAVWRANAVTIDQIGADIEFERHLITGDGRTDRARGVEISASAFRLYPSAPLFGRTLVEDDERPGAEPVAVIGHDLWQSRFEANPNVIGRTVHLGSDVYTIVGVMPEGFGFPVNHNLWTPLRVRDAGLKRGQGPVIWMFGRLKDGVSVDAAQAELQGLLNALGGAPADARIPNPRPPLRADVRPYLDSFLADDRESGEAMILKAANLVFVMLLGICGANVATLVFGRTAMREAEITLRTALGASRGRISAQLFAEALVLSGIGGIAGLMVARSVGLWGKQMWMEGTGEPRPFWWDDGFSPETVLYVAVLVVFAALIVGVIPALKATGSELQARLREAGTSGSSMKFGGLWTGVIMTQVAMTVMFLATVASLGWDVIREHYSFGVTYAREQFLTAQLEPDASRAGPDAPRNVSAETLQAIMDRLRTEAGVVGVTTRRRSPARRGNSSVSSSTDRRSPPARHSSPTSPGRKVRAWARTSSRRSASRSSRAGSSPTRRSSARTRSRSLMKPGSARFLAAAIPSE